jgi:hypothetical protein
MVRACLQLFIILTIIPSFSAAASPAERAEIVLFASAEVEATTGIKVTQYFVADDFELGFDAVATTASFVLGDWYGGFQTTFDGLIRWEIRAQAGDRPGELLARGTGYDVVYWEISPPGGSVYAKTYRIRFHLGQQVGLAAGVRYWLVLNVNQGLDELDYYSWVKAESVFSDTACFGDGNSGWSTSPIDLTFSVMASTEAPYLFADGFESGDYLWSWVFT